MKTFPRGIIEVFIQKIFCRWSQVSIDFNSNKYDRSDLEKSCARNDKQDINLRNDIYEFVLDEIRFLREKIVLKN